MLGDFLLHLLGRQLGVKGLRAEPLRGQEVKDGFLAERGVWGNNTGEVVFHFILKDLLILQKLVPEGSNIFSAPSTSINTAISDKICLIHVKKGQGLFK